jgi:predicted lipid-binding transport protein (Tim44 family)
MLLALVIVVLVVMNYTKIFAGFTTLETSPPQPVTAQPTPAAAYVANSAAPATQAQISGTSGTGNVNAASQTATVTSPLGAFDPAAYLTAFEQGVGGFGGIV